MSSRMQTLTVVFSQAVHTRAAGEVGNVAVFEDLRVLQHLSQASQTRAAHNPHGRSHLCVGQQPVRCGPALLIATTDRTRGNTVISNTLRVWPFSFAWERRCVHISGNYRMRSWNLWGRASCTDNETKWMSFPAPLWYLHEHSAHHKHGHAPSCSFSGEWVLLLWKQ